MEMTFWDKVVAAFQYNDVIWHNVFLTIVYIIIGVAVAVFVSACIGQIRNRKYTAESGGKSSKGFLTGFLIGFVILIFPIGLFLTLSIALGSAGSVDVSAQSVFYTHEGKSTMMTLTSEFQANSVENGITSGSSKVYAVAIQPETGKRIWKTKLLKGPSSGKKIIGVANEKAWIFDGKNLQVINKQNGKIIADEEKLAEISPTLKNQFPTNTAWYVFKDKHVLFKGLDGQVYEVDADSMKGNVKEGVNASDIFESDDLNNIQSAQGQIVASGKSDGKYFVMMGAEDVQAIQRGSELAATSSERKYVYTTSLIDKGTSTIADQTKVVDQVFLNGGFLLTPASSNDKYTYKLIESIATTPKMPSYSDYSDTQAYLDALEAYQKALSNYQDNNSTYSNLIGRLNAWKMSTPVHIGNNATFIVEHNETTESASNILLSAVDTDKKKVLWTINTKAPSMHFTHQDSGNLVVSTSGSSEAKNILNVSLETGKTTGYNFQYNRTFSIEPN
ncbi:PA2928 family protein [Listeria booriae]|uniref:Uncharacterized protein n=1 Tax=Listeria booriae TaxID=1552123 RepID=A0A841ZYG0_9LIST|nr:PA2928 family protein [Listeria booriae]MBC1565686.1 hypothetical protein [Listeria booriae]